jgi:hypothetical protein
MKLDFSKAALRIVEQIESSSDKILTMSQARAKHDAVIELLNHGLLIHGTFADGIECYKLTKKANRYLHHMSQ